MMLILASAVIIFKSISISGFLFDPISSTQGTNNLAQCTAMIHTTQAYKDCATFNKSMDSTTDVCGSFQTSLGCTSKYVNLACPDELHNLHKTIHVPPTCNGTNDGGLEKTSCDKFMEEVCLKGYELPPEGSSQQLYDFICSGRIIGYMKCLQKVQDMCSLSNTSKVDSSAILDTKMYTVNYTDRICADKTGFASYTNCLIQVSNLPEAQNCYGGIDNMDICSTMESAVRCNFNVMMKVCPQSVPFYQMLLTVYAPHSCDLTSVIGTPPIPVAGSSTATLSMLSMTVCILHALNLIFS